MPELSLRHELNAEFHARPPLPLTGSTRVRHRAKLFDVGAASAQQAHLESLLALGWSPEQRSDAYALLKFGRRRLRWELHTEFASVTLLEDAGADIHDDDQLMAWLEAMPGETLVCLRIDHRKLDAESPEQVLGELAGNDRQLVVSRIVDGLGWIATDFQFDQDELRILLLDAGLTRRQAGRTVQRLWEIETYRLLALLGLPVAKHMGAWLRAAEDQLAHLMDRIGIASGADDEHEILAALSRLAAEVEHSVARTAFRFGASRAYHAIVMQRIEELREQRVSGFPTLREFMDRRLQPPMNTCVAMAGRQEDLSARVARNSQLLRTRVDIALERQNQQLLAQMNQRTRQQLHLQETVEGLSVVAITYYASQLVHYLSKGAHEAGLAVDPVLATAASIPLIALAVWSGMRRLRRDWAKAD